MKKERNLNLDCLRVTACVAVVGLHTLKTDIDISVFNSIFYYLFGFAVPVFFMSSGYILINRNQISFDYILHKIANILIVVSLWSVTLFIVITAYHLYFDSNYQILIYEPIMMIGKSLIQKGTLWHFWYFGALIIVYLFCFVINKASQKQKIVVWSLMLILSLGIQLASFIIGRPLQKNIIQTFRVWCWFQYFILGGLMPTVQHDLYRKINLDLHLIALGVVCLVLPTYQFVIGKFVINEPHAEYFYDDAITIIWIVLLFSYIMRIELSERIKSLVQFLSPYTMGIYIVHPLMIKFVSHFISLDSSWISIIAFPVIFVMSLLITVVLMKMPIFKRYVVL